MKYEWFIPRLISALLLLLLLILIVMTSGCALFQGQSDSLPDPGSDLVSKIIVQNNWLLTISILGVGAGFFAFLNGNSKGLSIMATCFVVMSIVLMLAKFAIWLAIFATICSFGLLAYTILTRKRALKEIIETVEKTREDLSEDMDNHLFGNEESNGYVKNLIQHPATIKLVKKIKGEKL